jgi:paraquat-inducible protein A
MGQLSDRAWHFDLTACHACDLLIEKQPILPGSRTVCPRCGAAVHPRRPDSLARTWALAITALICLIPANLYPIMTLTYRGEPETSTIIDGVILLVKDQAIPIAVVIFIASIAVPFLKVFGLITLLLSIQLKWHLSPRQRTLLYRIIEAIGRWSMLDIFTVSILVALVQLGSLAEIVAGPAATFFCLAVVITIFAAMSFDSRLIWDGRDEQKSSR